MTTDSSIAIIGGGLAGFAVGIYLIKRGFKNVTVFERDESFDQRRQGYGLTILQGIVALRKLDVFEQVKSMDTPSRTHYMFDCHGNIIGFFGTKFWSDANDQSNLPKNGSAKPKRHNLHIGRQDLRRILYDKFTATSSDLSTSGVRWNHRLEGLDGGLDNKVKLRFSSSSDNSIAMVEKVYDADFVIGCDGINSRVRKHLYSQDNMLNYLGIIVVLGITGSSHFLSHERVFQTVDGTTRLFAMPFSKTDPGQNIMWQLSFPLAEGHARNLAGDVEALKRYVFELCGTWHEPIPSMIRDTRLDLIMGIPAYDRDPSLPLTIADAELTSRVVLLGDAAHPMSPFKGQGANQALLDAVSLVEHLEAGGSALSEAIARFNVDMMKRVESKVMMSRERVAEFHSPTILNYDSFLYRGISTELLHCLRECDINSSSGAELENLILDKMKQFNLIPAVN